MGTPALMDDNMLVKAYHLSYDIGVTIKIRAQENSDKNFSSLTGLSDDSVLRTEDWGGNLVVRTEVTSSQTKDGICRRPSCLGRGP